MYGAVEAVFQGQMRDKANYQAIGTCYNAIIGV